MELLFEFRLFCCMSIRSNSAVFDRITSPPMFVILAVSLGSVLNIDVDFGFGWLELNVDDGCDAFLSTFPSRPEFFRESNRLRLDCDGVGVSVFGAVDSGNCCDLYCDFSLVNGNAHFFTNWFAWLTLFDWRSGAIGAFVVGLSTSSMYGISVMSDERFNADDGVSVEVALVAFNICTGNFRLAISTSFEFVL